MKLLRDGGSISIIDIECNGENNSTINLADIHDRVQTTDAKRLLEMINEQDDAETADVILQQVFFKETIFG